MPYPDDFNAERSGLFPTQAQCQTDETAQSILDANHKAISEWNAALIECINKLRAVRFTLPFPVAFFDRDDVIASFGELQAEPLPEWPEWADDMARNGDDDYAITRAKMMSHISLVDRAFGGSAQS